MKYLIVVDMQNDFVYDALRNEEAIKIIPALKKKISSFDGEVIYTRDTHYENYLSTQEGIKLPVVHCIKGTKGHEIIEDLDIKDKLIFDKPIFGSTSLANHLLKMSKSQEIESIELVGVCTDICVISNAVLLKSFLPEVKIIVDSRCTAGVTPKSHEVALEAMKNMQIEVL